MAPNTTRYVIVTNVIFCQPAAIFSPLYSNIASSVARNVRKMRPTLFKNAMYCGVSTVTILSASVILKESAEKYANIMLE